MFDALISGSGVNGAALALLLDQAGFNIKVIDHHPIDLSESPRTVTLNLQSLQLLEKIGIEIPSTPINNIEVRDAVGSGKITFHASDITENELARTVYFADLTEALNTRIKTIVSDSISEEISTGADKISVECKDGNICNARLLIASDAKLKPIKQFFGLPDPKDYQQQAATFIVHSENMDTSTATQVFYNKDIFALMPIHDRENPQGNNFSVVWSLDIQEVNLQTYVLQHLPRLENILGTKLLILSEIESFPLKSFTTNKYHAERACLIGDAAHIIHPMAGQGLNLGLADCSTLFAEITKANESGIDIGSSQVLKKYEIKRKIFNDSMVKGVDRIHALFQSDDIYMRLLRNNGLTLVNRIEPLKRFFIKSAEGIFGI